MDDAMRGINKECKEKYKKHTRKKIRKKEISGKKKERQET
jgi:hypothetical protein